jgi:hypothetical protein
LVLPFKIQVVIDELLITHLDYSSSTGDLLIPVASRCIAMHRVASGEDSYELSSQDSGISHTKPWNQVGNDDAGRDVATEHHPSVNASTFADQAADWGHASTIGTGGGLPELRERPSRSPLALWSLPISTSAACVTR